MEGRLSRSRLVWIALPLLAGCTHTTESAARARSDVGSRLPAIRTAALVALDVKEYEVSAGGVAELKEDWSVAAQKAIQDALTSELRARQIDLRRVEPEPDTTEEIDDLRALSEAINASMRFPNSSFDYSLGPVSGLVDRFGVDALVFVWARARLPTGGRKFVAALYGSGGAEVGQVAIIIVDRSGDVLWYDHRALVGARADLRSAETAGELMRVIVGDLPRAGR
jgi:hypothetical protein